MVRAGTQARFSTEPFVFSSRQPCARQRRQEIAEHRQGELDRKDAD